MASNKILVIDDTTVVRVKVREMLPPGNFEVVEAKDGMEGLNFILQEKFSLIMLDFLLPKMSGWEVFQHIQSQPELRKIPLVMMSGRKEEVTEKISEPFEYFEFLGKPFDQKQLIGAIKSAMAKSKQVRPEPVLVGAGVAVNNGSASNSSNGNSTVATSSTSNGTVQAPSLESASSGEIEMLNEKIVKMQLWGN